MKIVKDFLWKPEMSVRECIKLFGNLGYQATELHEASKIVLNMKRAGVKIFLTFTSNMVTSGLRGFFAQLCKMKIPNILVTTSGSIEEDIMKAIGEKFSLSSFNADDVELHYKKQKRICVSELLKEIGLMLNDENSILYHAAKNNIPIYCPGIADSSFGFQLFMFQQKHNDFIVDTIQDMQRVVTDLSFDDKKGLISLGGSTSKHYAVFAALLSGGFDYAVYMTTSHSNSGSFSGATTQEAKSWGKIKDDADAATVNGDVTITFPLMMCSVLDKLKEEGLLYD